MKKAKITLFILSACLLFVSLTHIFLPHWNNWKLKLTGADNPYLSGTDFNEEDMLSTALMLDNSKEGASSGFVWLPMAQSNDFYTDYIFTPTREIYWYASPGDAEPALVMEPGGAYRVTHRELMVFGAGRDSSKVFGQNVGAGLHSWPTYDAGWRYAFPPVAEADRPGTPKYCYIRYEDLKAIADGTAGYFFVNEEGNLRELTVEEEADYLRIRQEEFTLIDTGLFTEGLYYSPNLPAPFFDTFNIITLAAGVILLILAIFLPAKKKSFTK